MTSGAEGADGSRAGTTNSEGSEGSLVPASLKATTWNVWLAPTVSPEIVQEVSSVTQFSEGAIDEYAR